MYQIVLKYGKSYLVNIYQNWQENSTKLKLGEVEVYSNITEISRLASMVILSNYIPNLHEKFNNRKVEFIQVEISLNLQSSKLLVWPLGYNIRS